MENGLIEEKAIIEKILELLCEAAGCKTPLELRGKTIEICTDHGEGNYTGEITYIERIWYSNKTNKDSYEKFHIFFNTLSANVKESPMVIAKISADAMPNKLTDVEWRSGILFLTNSSVYITKIKHPCTLKISSC